MEHLAYARRALHRAQSMLAPADARNDGICQMGSDQAFRAAEVAAQVAQAEALERIAARLDSWHAGDLDGSRGSFVVNKYGGG